MAQNLLIADQPRERAIHYGIETLSTAELLALILRTGTKQHNALLTAMDVLEHYPSIYEFKTTTIQELQQIPGIGIAKALEILAAIELGRRLENSKPFMDIQVTNSEIIGQYLIQELKNCDQEHMVAVYLNSKNYIIHVRHIFIGHLNESVAHPREIFHYAVRYSANTLLIAHNHPSGDLSPSEADLHFTKRLLKCSELMGIKLIDHLIVGRDRYVSLKRLGQLD